MKHMEISKSHYIGRKVSTEKMNQQLLSFCKKVLKTY